MTAHGRKYGEQASRPIPVWNGIFDHYRDIGMSLWTFLWLIDRVTTEVDGQGRVLGGKPVKIPDIVASMKGSTYQMVRDQLDSLHERGYISKKRTPYGFSVEVRNSRKWGVWKRKEIGPREQSVPPQIGPTDQSTPERLVSQTTQIGPTDQNKEDTAVHSSKETQQLAAAWKAIGSNLPMGTPGFQKLFEHYFLTRNDNPLSDAMGGRYRQPINGGYRCRNRSTRQSGT